MIEANWEIRIGGEYRVMPSTSSYGGHFRRVTVIDGNRIHFESFFGDEPEEIFTRDHVNAAVFRAMSTPEDQSPIKDLVEALKNTVNLLEAQAWRWDDDHETYAWRWDDDCVSVQVVAAARAALAKAESVSPQEVNNAGE